MPKCHQRCFAVVEVQPEHAAALGGGGTWPSGSSVQLSVEGPLAVGRGPGQLGEGWRPLAVSWALGSGPVGGTLHGPFAEIHKASQSLTHWPSAPDSLPPVLASGGGARR